MEKLSMIDLSKKAQRKKLLAPDGAISLLKSNQGIKNHPRGY